MVSCITLLSDFGLRDSSVAAVKGMLMQYTSAPIVDISHEVTPFLAGQAAYLLSCAYKSFPRGTVHLLLFDVFSSPHPALILSEHEGHYFLAPDNGVVPSAIGLAPASWSCPLPEQNVSFNDWLYAAGTIISKLQTGSPASLSLAPYDLANDLQQTATNQDALECEVIHIDHYENVVLNITHTLFEASRNGRSFRLQFAMVEEIEELSNNYHDVREGYKLCRFNGSDHMEICVNRGGAASLFGLRLGSQYNNIKILFG